jgi:hypothetical protein
MERRIPYRRGFKQPQFCTKRCRTKTERNRKVSTPFHRGLEHTKTENLAKPARWRYCRKDDELHRGARNTAAAHAREGSLFLAKLAGWRSLPSFQTLPTRFGKAYLAQISRIIKLRYQVRGFPLGSACTQPRGRPTCRFLRDCTRGPAGHMVVSFGYHGDRQWPIR